MLLLKAQCAPGSLLNLATVHAFISPARWHIIAAMTKLLDKALEVVRRLPSDSQDEIARAMLTLSDSDGEPEVIETAHLAAVLDGLAQAKRREFATDAEIEAAFRRFD
jgi:hypothetical protein